MSQRSCRWGAALAGVVLASRAALAENLRSHDSRQFLGAALSDKASEGEQLMILGLQAGANADTKGQRDYYQRLVSAHPRDERAHFLTPRHRHQPHAPGQA